MRLLNQLSQITLVLSLIIFWSCSEMYQSQVEVPLFLVGVDTSESIEAYQGVEISIDRADLAFGPLYLCAGSSAGELCDTARLEWLESVVVDMTSPIPKQVGNLSGVTGPLRSWMYDLGISSQLTHTTPLILDAARELGGVSLVLEGRARLEEFEIPFRAKLSLEQTEDTELGVPVVRKSISDRFTHEVNGQEESLTITFDPKEWLKTLDFTPYLQNQNCNMDCTELNQVCVPHQDCIDHLEITPDTELYRALRNAVLSGARPSFDWSL